MPRFAEITITLKAEVTNEVTKDDIDGVKAVLVAHAREEALMKLFSRKVTVMQHHRTWVEG
jgi:hypothetical protein